MSERAFLFLVGAAILLALYFELDVLIYCISALLIFEAITDIRLTRLLQKARHVELEPGLVVFNTRTRFNLTAVSWLPWYC